MKLWSFDVRSERRQARLISPYGEVKTIGRLSPGLYIMISQGVPVGG